MDAYLELVKVIGTGLTAGLLSAWLARRDHRYKTWWQMRVEAYQGLIEALSDLAYVYGQRFNHEINGHEPGADANEHLSKLGDEAYAKVRKAADSGAFLFSLSVLSSLAELRKEYERGYDHYIEAMQGMADESEKCLAAIVAVSRNDLAVG